MFKNVKKFQIDQKNPHHPPGQWGFRPCGLFYIWQNQKLYLLSKIFHAKARAGFWGIFVVAMHSGSGESLL